MITQKLEHMGKSANSNPIQRKRKAVSALFPYALILERRGQWWMLDALSRAAMVANSRPFMWYHIKSFILTLFDNPNPPSLSWVLGLIAPGVLWRNQSYETSVVAWRTVSSSCTREIGLGAVDEVLQVAFTFPEQPTILLAFQRRPSGAGGDVVRRVRALGDPGILKSYLLLLWSEWFHIDSRSGGLDEMQISIREDFSGIGMGCHREDLIKRLDHILEQLNRNRATQLPREQYEELRRLLLEVDGDAVNTLSRASPRLRNPFWSTNTHRHVQNLTQPSCALYPYRVHNFTSGRLGDAPTTNDFACTFAPILAIASHYTHLVILVRTPPKTK